MSRLALFLLLALAAPARSQETKPAAPTPGAAKRKAPPSVSFNTKRPWEAARWYAVGKWVQGNGIRWLGGGTSSRIELPAACLQPSAPFAGTLERGDKRDESLKNAEILSSGDWVAIELSPNIQEEEFVVKGRNFGANPSCQARLALSYAWSKGGGTVTPLLLLTSRGSRFYGYEINIDPPVTDTGEVADITLDLLLGFWPGKVPNAASTSKKALNFAPVATVRGEWLPFNEYWGLTLGLEQTVASFGGAANQKALFSDWQVGSFGEIFLPVADSLQLRGGLRYKQHLADDAQQARSLLQANKDAKYIVISTTMALFFAKAWMIGVDADYGLNGQIAGRGVDQGYLNGLVRIGFRTSAFMFLLLEGGYRQYRIKGFPSEEVTMAQLGIRLDL